MNQLKKVSFLGLTALLLCLSSRNAFAHFLWVNADHYSIETGEEVTLSLGWGHDFPEGGPMSAAEPGQPVWHTHKERERCRITEVA